jgi:asparagine synthase (glutamine-hydrolysing)
LHTVYANCGMPSADETIFVDAVLSQGGLEHHIAKVSGPIATAHLVTGYLDQPVYIPTPAMIWAAMYKTHANGVRVLLTGHDGDTIVSHGYEYLSELALAGEWAILQQMLLARVQAEGIDLSDPDPPAIGHDIQTRLINDYILLHLKDLARECMVKDLAQSLYSIFRYLRSLSPRVARRFLRDLYFNSYYKLRYRPKHIWLQSNPCLNTHFAEHIFLDRLIRNDMAYTDAYLPTALAYHHLGLASDNLQLGTDEAGHMAAALAIEPRHPFLDKRLVELCLAVPAHLKFDEGRGRGVMRQAMKNILPEQVRIRTTKVCFFGFIVREMQTTEKTLLEDLLFGRTSELADYLDINTLRQQYQDFLDPSLPWATHRRLARILLRTAHLVMWLRSVPRRLARGI